MVHEFYKKVVVLDNSVLLKAFMEEEFSEVVDELVDMSLKRDVTFLAPSVLVYEFFNIIARAYSKDLDIKKAFRKFKMLNIGLVDLEDEILLEVADMVQKNMTISFYDASYHALAKDMDAVFLTADKRYYDSMKKKGNVEYLGNLKAKGK